MMATNAEAEQTDQRLDRVRIAASSIGGHRDDAYPTTALV